MSAISLWYAVFAFEAVAILAFVALIVTAEVSSHDA